MPLRHEVALLFIPTPPHQQHYSKSKIAAGILAILLGTLGIQYFYIGKIGAGFLTILTNILFLVVILIFSTLFMVATCGLGAVAYNLIFLPYIIYLAQGIEMICISDEDFNRKFVTTKKFWPLF